MKKHVLVMVMALVCLMVFAKARPSNDAPKEKTLMEQGLLLIEQMMEKVNCDAYIEMTLDYAGSEALEKIEEMRGYDYSNPIAVYRLVRDPSSSFLQFMADMVDYDLSVFPPRLRETLEKNLFANAGIYWNSLSGNIAMFLATGLSSGFVFDSDELKYDCIYIYIFKDAYPVAVTFEHGEGKAVAASGSFVFDRDFPNSMVQMLEKADIEIKLETVIKNYEL